MIHHLQWLRKGINIIVTIQDVKKLAKIGVFSLSFFFILLDASNLDLYAYSPPGVDIKGKELHV